MKARLLTAALVAAFLAFTGCSVEINSGEDSSSSASPTVSESTPTASPSTTETDQKFLTQVRDNTNSFDSEKDATLVDLAHSVCDALDRGVSFEQLGQLFIENGYAADEAGYFVGSAVGFYCPEYVDDINSQGV